MEEVLQIGIVLCLLLVGWIAGSAAEARHYRSLRRREQLYSGMLVTQLRSFPSAVPFTESTLVVSEVVIATDYLKSFVAGLKKIIGGELRSYLSLLERARREAVLRLAEEARRLGFNAVCNIRLESTDIGGVSKSTKGAVMVTLIAYGTAYHAQVEKGDGGSAD